MRLCTIILFVVFFASQVATQSGIKFYLTDLETGLEIARKENKSLFVDAFAEWCIPCKKMEKVFRDPRVGKVFNETFVNVKLDMDLPSSEEAKLKYDIVFLPTFMILDPEGNVRYKVDKLLSGEDLLHIANLTSDPGTYFVSEATQILDSPIALNYQQHDVMKIVPVSAQEKKQPPVQPFDLFPIEGEQIVYIMDGNNASVTEEVLYQEAYFRMELMDGSHHQAALRYLQSQENWDAEKNIRFIYDFLDDTDSELFNYFISHQADFEEYYSPRQLEMTKSFLINQKLEQGLPSAEFNKAVSLFTLLASEDPEFSTYQYFLEKFRKDRNITEFRKLGAEAMAKYPEDHGLRYTYTSYLLNENLVGHDDLNQYLEVMKEALHTDSAIPEYHKVVARIYYLLGTKDQALNHAEQALKLLNPSENSYAEARQLKNLITRL